MPFSFSFATKGRPSHSPRLYLPSMHIIHQQNNTPLPQKLIFLHTGKILFVFARCWNVTVHLLSPLEPNLECLVRTELEFIWREAVLH